MRNKQLFLEKYALKRENKLTISFRVKDKILADFHLHTSFDTRAGYFTTKARLHAIFDIQQIDRKSNSSQYFRGSKSLFFPITVGPRRDLKPPK
ncbi:hypothetical protein CEXT_40201 [Caerostris extrusa]|uniref:Uncharacterized protein n=1 Tax=Caerostris extrusa TaxID=172846 RepID=A0AAV4UP46_CAEEX|nr:hypothetical protein CEXT_40201 [Caerostris extrusa]